jgi:BirA family transcriptional regulator, biotin operon repressor / biotin---[acetyl-CoA-carboxylase] ligase
LQRFNTLFIGKVVHNFEELPSTNAHALSLLSKSKPPEGTVISAYRQYDGRGQIGSKWESEAGQNITLSIVLYPDFLPVREQFQLNQAVALAVYDLAVSNIKENVFIKWPNDIYVGHKKIAGILIQNTVSGEKLTASVIGIGINVNQEHFITNPPNPSSFKLQTEKTFSVQSVSEELFYRLEKRYLSLKFGNSRRINEEYHEVLYRRNQFSHFTEPSGAGFEAIIRGVDKTGKLILEKAGKEFIYGLKEVSLQIPKE